MKNLERPCQGCSIVHLVQTLFQYKWDKIIQYTSSSFCIAGGTLWPGPFRINDCNQETAWNSGEPLEASATTRPNKLCQSNSWVLFLEQILTVIYCDCEVLQCLVICRRETDDTALPSKLIPTISLGGWSKITSACGEDQKLATFRSSFPNKMHAISLGRRKKHSQVPEMPQEKDLRNPWGSVGHWPQPLRTAFVWPTSMSLDLAAFTFSFSTWARCHCQLEG